MAAKLWIVCQKGWEYDDNNYYCSDGVGDPLTAYRTKERAQQVAVGRNQERIRELFDSGELSEYLGSDGWHSFVEERAVSLLYRLFDEYGVKLADEYGNYILPDDPLSARQECHWSMETARGDWVTRTETYSSMSASATHFRITGRLEAYEGDKQILARHWDKKIKRRLL